jgi:hypothetical protein
MTNALLIDNYPGLRNVPLPMKIDAGSVLRKIHACAHIVVVRFPMHNHIGIHQFGSSRDSA